MSDWADKSYLRTRKSITDRVAEWLFAAAIILALSFLCGYLDR